MKIANTFVREAAAEVQKIIYSHVSKPKASEENKTLFEL
jgi:hypothetical protein